MQRLQAIRLSTLLLTFGLAACSGGHRDATASEGTSGGGGAGAAANTPTPPAASRTLTLKGSDTMVILAQRFAERYMQAHPGTTIQVSGGGSGTGIAALLNGTTDIANASRPLKETERAQIAARGHGQAVETKVAVDALAVYVNQNNPVARLDMDQLKRIFRGEVTNWNQVGGPDRPIVLYSRENNSGTYAYFKEHVLGNADFAANAQTLPGTAAVINAVSHDPNGIGYGGIAYGAGVKHVPVMRTPSDAPVEPTMQNALSGSYPLSRFLYMYTAGAPQGLAADFLTWAVSPEGQTQVEGVGFYPLPRDGQLGAGTAQASATGAPPAAQAPNAPPAAQAH